MKVNRRIFGKVKKVFLRGALLLLVVSLVPKSTPAFTWGTNVNDSVTELIVVSGVTLPITTMSLQFTNFNCSRPADQDMLLVAPDGVHNLAFMSDGGGNSSSGLISFTLSDTGATPLPNGAPIVNGTTYRPGDYGGAETYPGFAGTVNHAQTNGVATFTTAFGSASGLPSANGTWQLIIVDDATAGEVSPINSIGRWALIINGATAAGGSIGGKVTDGSGVSVSGAVMNLSGAQNRTAITDSQGNYQFDDVAANGFYTVSPSRSNYAFTPSSRSFSQIGNHTDAAFTGSFTGDNANPADTSEYFVRQQYLDFLGREPDEGGLAFWSNRLNSCNGDAACIRQERIDVSAAFFMSSEFRDTGSFVYGMYAGLLGRTPGYDEFTPDRSQVVGGSGLEPAKAAFAQNFVQRGEFMNRYPDSLSREQFVDAVLETVQQRSGIDPSSQRDGLLADYDSGGRALVAQHAAEAPMFVSAEYNKAFVLMEYYGYLRRGTDQNGYDFWLNIMSQGGGSSYRGMVCSFLTSSEYQRRFSTIVTHNNSECGQ